ncbi:hypothetical protein M514_05359, partial [Trichuris suis]
LSSRRVDHSPKVKIAQVRRDAAKNWVQKSLSTNRNEIGKKVKTPALANQVTHDSVFPV